jgi:hypothetical protein
LVKFDPPMILKPQGENTDVIIFGKSPEQTQNDRDLGISRFGGKWKQPCYLQAYLRSSRILFFEGISNGKLDDIGLPLFYIQRHTTELLLKRLLRWIFGIVLLNNKLGEPSKDFPTKSQKDHFKRSHSLNLLFDDLKTLTKFYKFNDLPDSLEQLVKLITKSEMTEIWSRYSTSSIKGDEFNHVENEQTVYIKNIQKALELAVSDSLIEDIDNEDVYEYPLYDEWLTKARKTGDAG